MSLHQDPTQTAVRRQKRSLWTDAWRRMRRSHTAVIGMILFALIVIVCFSAPLFSDYDAQVINSDLAMIRKYPVEGHPLGTDELFRNPRHPYTQALLSAIPVPSLDEKKPRMLLKGELTSPINPKPACRFAPRCPYAKEQCRCSVPEITDLGSGHTIRCFYPQG